MESDLICKSIRSVKKQNLRCEAKATRGEFCARHNKSRVIWTSSMIYTLKQKKAHKIIYRFWNQNCKRHSYRIHGPCFFDNSLSHNDTDMATLGSLKTIPHIYHFSYIDPSGKAWTFDIRFIIQMLHYGNQLMNPYTQEVFLPNIINRINRLSENLRAAKFPILYVDDELTPDQLWNQKVLDVFLKLNSLGFGSNILWFDSLNVRGHILFYTNLYNLWHTNLDLTHEDRERIVSGYSSGRAPLFRWNPESLERVRVELKWWRKTNLGLMNSFLKRGQDPSKGALYILTALANSSRGCGESYSWLLTNH